jgi:PAS domain S-box-containing protein
MKDNSKEQLIKKLIGQGICDSIGDGISIQDTDFKILYQNHVYKDLVGDHVGEYCYKAYKKRDNICKDCPLALVFKKGTTNTTERSISTDKGTVYVEITASPLRDSTDSTGKIIGGIEVVRDISERKKAEEIIHDSEKKFKSFFENVSLYCYMVSQEGIILDVNNAALNMLDAGLQ